MLSENSEVPDHFSRPEVLAILKNTMQDWQKRSR